MTECTDELKDLVTSITIVYGEAAHQKYQVNHATTMDGSSGSGVDKDSRETKWK
jgi:hypothetical protein